MSDPGMRLEPEDEFTHRPDAATNFNESVYANGFDPRTRTGAWMRLGNRVNEGYAELSVVIYLPDGRVACQFQRPEIATNDAFDAGGLRYEAVRPFEQVRMSYSGEVLLLDDPQQLRDPKAAFASAPRAPASIDFDITGVSPVHGGEPTGPEHEHRMYYGPEFSRGHFNQHTRAVGTITVGDETIPIDGFGWRDHSWGPRYWQVIWAYRLFIATLGEDRALMLLKNMYPDGTARRLGVLLIDDAYEEVTDLDLQTTWSDAQDPVAVTLGVRTAKRTAVIEGRVMTMAPLRNRRRDGDQVLVSRVAEGFTEYRWDDRTGCGMMEYIERIEDGGAVGYPL
ncbi:MAG TPA: hypothetical protein VFN55_11510 [Solirubrobacteraceae bacterium]|nr:hypothetical protein [Solirubrobacteraceae bacterium]